MLVTLSESYGCMSNLQADHCEERPPSDLSVTMARVLSPTVSYTLLYNVSIMKGHSDAHTQRNTGVLASQRQDKMTEGKRRKRFISGLVNPQILPSYKAAGSSGCSYTTTGVCNHLVQSRCD
jgi:hypothetical protein